MPTSVGVISQIQLPNGHIYDIVDRVSAHGLTYVIAYKSGEPVVSNIPAGVTVVYNNTAYLGTKAADSTTYEEIYLVKSTSQEGVNDFYDEYITLREGAEGNYTYSWEKLGDTRITIKDISVTKVSVSDVDVSSTSATVSGGTTDKVLGVDTTFTGSSSFTDTSTKKYLHKNAYVKGYPNVTTDSFAKTVTPSTKKLVTTSITGVSGSTSVTGVSGSTSVLGVQATTTTASKATAGTAKNVATTGSNVTVGTGSNTASTTNTDILKGATVSNEVLSLGACTLNTTSVTPAVSNGTITPYTFTDVDVPKLAASATTVPIAASSATTVPVAATAKTVATGALAASDTSGATIVTNVSVGSSGDAITGLGTPSTGNAYDTLNTTASGGDVVVTNASGTVSTTITKGTNDQVDALTTAGTVTVPLIDVTPVEVVKDVTYTQNDDANGQ